MTDPTHSDMNAKIRAIVDDAIAELYLVGFDSRDQAAKLMAIQSIIRIDDLAVAKEIAAFAAEMAADYE